MGKAQTATNRDLELRAHCDARLGSLKSDRWSWWGHWRELGDYILPRRYLWLITPNKGNRGSPINQKIIDCTATVSARTLASGMMSGLTSPSRPWFRLTIPNDEAMAQADVRLWLDEVQKRMLRVFAESNFYNALAVMYLDLGVFGTAPMLIYEDYEDVIRCYNAAPGEYFLANSDRLEIDTFCREFVMTTKQLVQWFGLENCSPTTQQAFKQGGAGLTREVLVGHLIEPSDTYVEGDELKNGKAFREVYWERTSGWDRILQAKDYWEFPCIAPRWDIVNNDAYGRSPAMDALGDIKQLQVEQKRKAQAIDKMVNPPLLADVSLKNEPASMLPGGVTYVERLENGSGMRPVYQVEPRIAEMMEDIQEVQSRIKDVFFVPLFLMISELNTVRTATEIDARREEKLIQLGPVTERFQNEALDKSIERTFNIMLRRGLLPKPPLSVQGQHFKVEYISMLAQAQKAVSVGNLERAMQFVGQLGAVIPGVLDKVNSDSVVDLYFDGLDVSPKALNSDKAVEQQRAIRTQQQQDAAITQNSLAAAQGAKTLSQADVGGGRNALQALTGG